MKKLILIPLALLIIVLVLVRCNSKKEEPTPTVDEPVVVEKQEEEVKQEEPVIVEETKQEEKEDTTTKVEDKTKDVTQMSFWVVFYDQYGNELQREALKYGTTPTYKVDLPAGFEKWVYKKSQKDANISKAITGNTYYQAICHEVNKHHSGGSSNNPISDEPEVNEYGFYYNTEYSSDDFDIDINIVFTDYDYQSCKLAILETPDVTSDCLIITKYTISGNKINIDWDGEGAYLDININDNGSLAMDIGTELIYDKPTEFNNGGVLNNQYIYLNKTILACLKNDNNTLELPNGFENVHKMFSEISVEQFNLDSVTSIKIPSSISDLGDYNTFRDFTSLNSIVIDQGNTKYNSRNNCNAIIETATNALVFGCKNSTIPSGVTKILEFAFNQRNDLQTITIPNTVTTIEESAFSGCLGLTSVTFENDSQLTEIGDYAFHSCQSLTSIALPDGLTLISIGLFEDCTSLSSVILPASLTSIGISAFEGCSNLSISNLPNNLNSIGARAFANCTSLTSLTIPDTVTTIGDVAFLHVPNINYNGSAVGSPWGALALNGSPVGD